ncbi:carboxypeptidase-like regulatory domain-containing protein [Neptunitalea lumnitzerae]|uniref:Carboxypeptidase-like regulatory domain-containing protein n=1 Tax=Neptunitalea lumnitzerae TaxID=2965509 RepID=A0ABQ5MG36_9FLAO|nr:carboxypeptidase-like regulatory domain-containing protein [Neptunitalea sp. Y10]GLB48381.1 hypothetical protein Y10_07490 [Neptunitalea sp. Y10]
MPKTLYFFLLFLVVTIASVNAQAIVTGYVYDHTTKEPMQGVTVYFDGTSIGTVTNKEGYFELETEKQVTASLIVSYIGYESVHINNPYAYKDIKFYLKETSFALDEVVLQADPFTREAKMVVFRKEFLGQEYEGNCKILNEDVIIVTYDMTKSKLLAFASEPLKIMNTALGYEVTYNLVDFEVVYTQNSLSSMFIQSVYYAGTSFYNDISEGQGKYKRRRRKIYYGSPLHFMRTLAKEELTEEKFGVYKRSFPVDPLQHFTISDSLGLKYVTATQPKWNLLYKKDEQSAMQIYTDGFFIDSYGNFTPVDALVFGGYMGKLRFKDMLPLDYYPDK